MATARESRIIENHKSQIQKIKYERGEQASLFDENEEQEGEHDAQSHEEGYDQSGDEQVHGVPAHELESLREAVLGPDLILLGRVLQRAVRVELWSAAAGGHGLVRRVRVHAVVELPGHPRLGEACGVHAAALELKDKNKSRNKIYSLFLHKPKTELS